MLPDCQAEWLRLRILRHKPLARLPAPESSLFARGLQSAIAFFENLFFPPFEFVFGCNIADGAVKPPGVVILDISAGNAFGLLERERRFLADAFAFDRLVE